MHQLKELLHPGERKHAKLKNYEWSCKLRQNDIKLKVLRVAYVIEHLRICITFEYFIFLTNILRIIQVKLCWFQQLRQCLEYFFVF